MVESLSPYSSPPFKFMVENEVFYVHAELLLKVSKPLGSLIDINMIEKQQGWARLREVDAVTFKQFLEWVYTGHYKASVHEAVEQGRNLKVKGALNLGGRSCSSSKPAVYGAPSVQDASDSDTSDVIPIRNAGAPSRKRSRTDTYTLYDPQYGTASKEQLENAFISRRSTVRQDMITLTPPRPNINRNEDYKKVFLCHAKLYVFADKQDIDRLRILALEELHATLAVFTLYPSRASDIISLLRYAYANTLGGHDRRNDLRMLLTQYMGFTMETLMTDEGFNKLLIQDGGDIEGDFMKMVTRKFEGGQRQQDQRDQ